MVTQVPYGGSPPRQVDAQTSGSDGDAGQSRLFARHVVNPQIPPDRLYLAVLANMSSWQMDLDAIIESTTADTRSRALHLQRNILQAQVSLRRLAGEPDKETED